MNLFSVNLQKLFDENQKGFNDRSKKCFTYLVDREKGNKRFLFLVKCNHAGSSETGHIVTVKFNRARGNKNKTPSFSDVKVHCQCPAFLYWGVAYNSSNEKYNLEFKEDREPNIRDPKREIKLCKHLARVTRNLKGKTYQDLQKTRLKIQSSCHIPLVGIEECFSAIFSYIENFRKDIDPHLFISDLHSDNFEEKLIEIGCII